MNDTSVVHPEWMAFARCAGVPVQVFYGHRNETPSARAERERRARAYCDGCAAKAACRDHARHHREHGIWGGETDQERCDAGYWVHGVSVRARRRLTTSTIG